MPYALFPALARPLLATTCALSLAMGCAKPPPTETTPPKIAGDPYAEGKCFPSELHRVPAGWTRTGSIELTFTKTASGEKAVAFELRDVSGTVLETGTATLNTPLRTQVCRAGGVIAVLPANESAESGKEGKKATIELYKPPKEDEAADLAFMCREPNELKDSTSPALVWLGVELYFSRLTSLKWRGFITRLLNDADAAPKDGRPEVLKKAAATLEAAKAGCWFATVLARP